ncbi:MAG: glycoside hydrolase family 2 TIM barrel-domain containing protein [Candidatus Moraniibacteriota bacterium]
MWHVLKIIGIVALTVVAGLSAVFGYFNLAGPAPRQDVKLGMTFSSRYATDLGLDWRKTYLALLDEVGVKKLRLPVYWDLVETSPGEYHWGDLDWQLGEAERHGADVILTIGQRVPRWPECHIPAWVDQSADTRQAALLHFMGKTVERYKNNRTVITWQVENEPFLVFFGVCPPLDSAFLDQEVAFVKGLDPTRPVLLTDSGELSLWISAAKRGDIFGTTMYRHIWSSKYGYITYPIGPNFFRAKAWLVRTFTRQNNLMVIELQAEPWASGWVANVSLAEQFRTMDETKLRENVEYAKRVGFGEVYLWGGEWWYWLKVEKGYGAVWDEGKKIFSEQQ